ncbi:GTPase HflX [Gardnerella greenwoodii]|uniref:GTPase HflX n=1 Tax=Gardnerella greenwoodii TaxID=2914925 RepID=UPI0039EF0322
MVDSEGTATHDVLLSHSDVLLDNTSSREQHDETWQERESRNALKRVAGLGELQDVTEVEYRKLRLERVVLVGVWSSAKGTLAQSEESLRELAALAQTAGAVVCDGILQQRYRPDAATYVGSGKAREIAAVVAQHDADTIIVDDDLPPSQRRALEDVTKVKVVDRTAVILDIFAQHATSREGKAQVELAQLQYMLPRLRGWGATLSRQAGGRAAGEAGIGSRGPGETKIEMDRRAIRNRISKLRHDIAHMAPARDVKRESRRRKDVPTVAVVGYTNAGKSSIINCLTGSQELVENALFATLDTAVRRAQTQDGRNYTLVDTVGFVRRLPTQLVEAFKSTLEEVSQADVILHVVDGSHPDPISQIDAVNEVLSKIDGVEYIPQIIAFNKSDMMSDATREHLNTIYSNAIIVSAASGENVQILRDSIEELLPSPRVHIDAIIPYSEGSLLSKIRENGIVEKVDYLDTGISITALVGPSLAAKLKQVALQ